MTIEKVADCHTPEGQKLINDRGGINFRCIDCGHAFLVIGKYDGTINACPVCKGGTEFVGIIIAGKGKEAWDRNIKGTRAGHPWNPAA